jgi:hypothetical protein
MTVEANDEGSVNVASFVGGTAERFPKLSAAQIARLEARGTHEIPCQRSGNQESEQVDFLALDVSIGYAKIIW